MDLFLIAYFFLFILAHGVLFPVMSSDLWKIICVECVRPEISVQENYAFALAVGSVSLLSLRA